MGLDSPHEWIYGPLPSRKVIGVAVVAVCGLPTSATFRGLCPTSTSSRAPRITRGATLRTVKITSTAAAPRQTRSSCVWRADKIVEWHMCSLILRIIHFNQASLLLLWWKRKWKTKAKEGEVCTLASDDIFYFYFYFFNKNKEKKMLFIEIVSFRVWPILSRSTSSSPEKDGEILLYMFNLEKIS